MKIIKLLNFLILASIAFQSTSCDSSNNSENQEQILEDESVNNGPSKVEVRNDDGTPRIYRNGEPYFVKGAAYNNYLNEVKKNGGNSIRTYSINEDTQAVLDSAQQNGLSVTLGIWIKRETDGFDYNNQDAVKEQFDKIKEDVLKYKDHPALLMWGIGNEADASLTNFKMYDAVGQISDMIHEVDPNHITTTVLAGTKTDHIKEIMKRAPSLDVLSINTYAAIVNTHKKIKEVGWEKPYLITEWGPRGTWSSLTPSTSWGSLLELSSTEKAKVYRDIYSNHILANANSGCSGSYVFLWGFQNHGAVATWYGLFTRKKNPFGAVHSMHYSWKGFFPSNRAPQIKSDEVMLNGLTADQNIKLSVGQKSNASVRAIDFEGDNLVYEWHIVREGFIVDRTDDSPGILPSLTGLFEKSDEKNAKFSVNYPGKYRLYAFVIDSSGNAASAVIPFLVE